MFLHCSAVLVPIIADYWMVPKVCLLVFLWDDLQLVLSGYAYLGFFLSLDIKRSNFYLISFNILCEANGVYFPLELGLVEYSIEQGCTNTFHQFIDSGMPPFRLTVPARW